MLVSNITENSQLGAKGAVCLLKPEAREEPRAVGAWGTRGCLLLALLTDRVPVSVWGMRPAGEEMGAGPRLSAAPQRGAGFGLPSTSSRPML